MNKFCKEAGHGLLRLVRTADCEVDVLLIYSLPLACENNLNSGFTCDISFSNFHN